jgi:16S rRNA (guanine527-N7)-methyltransferase
MNTSDLSLFTHSLGEEAARLNLVLSEETLDLLSLHYKLLAHWNARIRLVGSAQPQRAASELFADSLMAGAFAESFAAKSASVIDIGAGAGFPGLPVKLAHPRWSLALVESNAKKVSFVKDVKRSLGLDIEIINARAEDLGRREEFRQKYDLAFCRAVAEPAAACELATPFVKVGGSFILQTQENYDHSILSRAAAELNVRPSGTMAYQLSRPPKNRLLVRMLKTDPTPSIYPRAIAAIKRHPLE